MLYLNSYFPFFGSEELWIGNEEKCERRIGFPKSDSLLMSRHVIPVVHLPHRDVGVLISSHLRRRRSSGGGGGASARRVYLIRSYPRLHRSITIVPIGYPPHGNTRSTSIRGVSTETDSNFSIIFISPDVVAASTVYTRQIGPGTEPRLE